MVLVDSRSWSRSREWGTGHSNPALTCASSAVGMRADRASRANDAVRAEAKGSWPRAESHGRASVSDCGRCSLPCQRERDTSAARRVTAGASARNPHESRKRPVLGDVDQQGPLRRVFPRSFAIAQTAYKISWTSLADRFHSTRSVSERSRRSRSASVRAGFRRGVDGGRVDESITAAAGGPHPHVSRSSSASRSARERWRCSA